MENISFILNEEGKYTTYLINEEDSSYKLVQLSDRNIPFSKHEIVSVFDPFTHKTIKKRLLNQDREKYYFEDGVEVEKQDNFVSSNKPELKSGFYKGVLLDFYFVPLHINKNKTAKAKYLGESNERVELEGITYDKKDLEFSHNYFNVTTKIVDVKKEEELKKIFNLDMLFKAEDLIKPLYSSPTLKTTVTKIKKEVEAYWQSTVTN